MKCKFRIKQSKLKELKEMFNEAIKFFMFMLEILLLATPFVMIVLYSVTPYPSQWLSILAFVSTNVLLYCVLLEIVDLFYCEKN